MKLLEYEAKAILSRYGITVPNSMILASAEDLNSVSLPAVIKSQVPVGGRGKAGGIRLVKDREELRRAFEEISTLDIKGFRPNKLLAEEVVSIDREMYLSLTIDRDKSRIELVVHSAGGIDIESQTDFLSLEIDEATIHESTPAICDYLHLPDSPALKELLMNLYRAFVDSDASLIEINPLILTESGNLVAGDCKMTLDSAAAFRHPDWDFEDTAVSANFVALDDNGEIATIANGAGLAMATVDAVKAAGLTPANFLDIGGSASVENIVRSFQDILKFPKVRTIIINIFGGIVRCDEVARAIIEAKKSFSDLPNLQIRLSGTNSEIAKDLLAAENIALRPSLKACIQEILRG